MPHVGDIRPRLCLSRPVKAQGMEEACPQTGCHLTSSLPGALQGLLPHQEAGVCFRPLNLGIGITWPQLTDTVMNLGNGNDGYHLLSLLDQTPNMKVVKVKSLTLCNPVDCTLPGSSVHGIFQARILEWVAISFSRGSFRLRA